MPKTPPDWPNPAVPGPEVDWPKVGVLDVLEEALNWNVLAFCGSDESVAFPNEKVLALRVMPLLPPEGAVVLPNMEVVEVEFVVCPNMEAVVDGGSCCPNIKLADVDAGVAPNERVDDVLVLPPEF